MATLENNDLPFSLVSIVEDVLQQHSDRLSDVGLASRKSEESSLRRYEAAGWLRKTAGVVSGRDLPAEPSEEEFRLGLRSGIILCNVLNKAQPGAVPKVVEAPSDSAVNPDGAALSAFQYFENVRNFLVAVEEMGLPCFEASDLEKGGKSARIVNCVLALKSYSEWKQSGGIRAWRYGVNMKPPASGMGKPFLRKNSEPFMSSISRTRSLDSSSSEQPLYADLGQDLSEAGHSRSINVLVRAFLSDKKHEEIPNIVESMLNKVMEEFERGLSIHNEMIKTSSKHFPTDDSSAALSRTSSCDIKEEKEVVPMLTEDKACHSRNSDCYVEPEIHLLNHQLLVEKQQRYIQELKQTLHVTKSRMQFLQTKYREEFANLGKHLHGLAYAATGYRRVLEENRKLYNQVQDLKGNIRVYCRVRPFLPGQSNVSSAVDHVEEGTITISLPWKHGKEGRKSFTFNKVFGPSATQEEVFSDTQPLIRSVLDGYNVCIFAYGQTGSGKTYTMTGPKELTQEGLGVNYRALTDLFLLSNQRKDTICYDISVQMLEIYNEQVRDLLAADGQNRRLEIRNSSQSGINVPDANLVPVSSTSDVIHMMNLGQKNRAVSATAMNDRSSRSHSCLTVHVQGRDLTSGTILHGSMHLVDLAGSERVDKSEVTGDRLKEAQHINKSLSALGDVISSLSQKNSHVPYRNSKLTQLLQDSLGGQAKTLMFVHISPEAEALGETISTLKFAERVGSVELGAAHVNKQSSEVKELKEQIASLKMALARKEGEMDNVHTSSVSRNPDRLMRRRSLGSPSLRPNFSSIGSISGSRKQQIEDLSGSEVLSDSASSRRHSLDLHELMQSPSSRQSPSLDAKDDDRESSSTDWIDKAMMNNKHEELTKDKNPDLPEKFSQKIYPEQQSQLRKSASSSTNSRNQDFEVQRIQYEGGTTDESDEGGTSDCSDLDLMWQLNVQVNVPRVSNIPGVVNSKGKKAQPKSAKGAETRSLIPSLIPPPTRKPPGTVSSQLQRPGRQPAACDGKRKPGHGK